MSYVVCGCARGYGTQRDGDIFHNEKRRPRTQAGPLLCGIAQRCYFMVISRMR